MVIFRFIFYLGVIYITFDALWKLFLYLVKSIFGITDRNRTAYFLFLFLYLFLLVTLTALTTHNYMEEHIRKISYLSFPIISLIVLYFYITSNMQKVRFRAKNTMDSLTIKRMKYNSVFLVLALSYFMVCIAFPNINENDFTIWVYGLIGDIYAVKLFKWIIGFFAFFFLINIFYRGIVVSSLIYRQIFRPKDTGHNTRNIIGNDINQDIEDVEYIEVDDD
jgi:hypothetical protein